MSGIIAIPIPNPNKARYIIMVFRLVVIEIPDSRNRVTVMMLRPTKASGRAPILSNNLPPSGMPITQAKACGSRISPVSSGV
ncbi:hypothetical protein D3C80_2030550 [compost metagenome]